jgi:hypothetical protein
MFQAVVIRVAMKLVFQMLKWSLQAGLQKLDVFSVNGNGTSVDIPVQFPFVVWRPSKLWNLGFNSVTADIFKTFV